MYIFRRFLLPATTLLFLFVFSSNIVFAQIAIEPQPFVPLPGGEDGTQYATNVVSFIQGHRVDGSPVLLDKSNEDSVLGTAETSGAEYDSPILSGSFLSLGLGGSITLGFAYDVVNVDGPDVSLFEVTGGTNYPPEKVQVEASENGSDWFLLTASVTSDGSIDLGELSSAKYLRITDISDPTLFEPAADGYDLDAVAATKGAAVVITGCTDSGATNYNPSATAEDGSCEYEEEIDGMTRLYPSIALDGKVIVEEIPDRTLAFYQDYIGAYPGGSVFARWRGCDYTVQRPMGIPFQSLLSGAQTMESGFLNGASVTSDGLYWTVLYTSCGGGEGYYWTAERKNGQWYTEYQEPTEVEGCTNPDAINYDPAATEDDGSCEYEEELLQCADGIDNDGDGLIDQADYGCDSGQYGLSDTEFADTLRDIAKSMESINEQMFLAGEGVHTATNDLAFGVNLDIVSWAFEIVIETVASIATVPTDSDLVKLQTDLTEVENITDLGQIMAEDWNMNVKEISDAMNAEYEIQAAELSRLKLKLFTEWLKDNIPSLSVQLGVDLFEMEKLLNPLIKLFDFIFLQQQDDQVLDQLSRKLDDKQSELMQMLTRISLATNITPEEYVEIESRWQETKSANYELLTHLQQKQLMIETIAYAKSDLHFKFSSLAWGLGISAGVSAILPGSSQAGKVVKGLLALDGTIKKRSDLLAKASFYVMGLDFFDSFGVFSEAADVQTDMVGLIYKNAQELENVANIHPSLKPQLHNVRLVQDEAVSWQDIRMEITNPSSSEMDVALLGQLQKQFVAHTLGIAWIDVWSEEVTVPIAVAYSSNQNSWITLDPDETVTIELKALPTRLEEYGVLTLFQRVNGNVSIADRATLAEADIVDVEEDFYNTAFSVAIQSPGELSAVDSEGRVTGLVEGGVFEQIPYSFYDPEAHTLMLFDTSKEYTYEVGGTGEGTYGFIMEIIDEDSVESFHSKAVPISVKDKHSWKMGDTGGVTEIELSIDENGDGTTEVVIIAEKGLEDEEAPSTNIIIKSDAMLANVYWSSVQLILDARDNAGGVGVEKTEYSFDNENWIEYTGTTTVSEEGEYTIYYRSTDWFGNLEDTKQVSFEIVSAQGLVEEVHDWAQESGVVAVEKLLRNVLKEKYWEDRNSLIKTGEVGVLAQLKAAVGILKKAGNTEQVERLELAEEILTMNQTTKPKPWQPLFNWTGR